MSYNPLNPNGQATMANSEPVVIASNQSPVSVAGTVNVGNLPTNQNVSGSVVAFQGAGWSGSVAVGNFPTTQNVSGSVVAFQAGTQINSISGQVTVVSSIAGGIFPVSGSVASAQIGTRSTSISGQVTVVSSIAGGIFPVSGSVAAVVTNTPNVNVAGSVVAFQAGTQITSIAGTPNVAITSIATPGQVMGSIAALQATNPWIITGSVQGSFSPAANQSVSGTVQVDVRNSIAAVIIGGSIATATTNSSVMLLNGTNVIGSVMTLQGTNPWIITGSVQGSFSPAANQSVSGEVNVVQTTNPWIITGSVQGSFSPAANQSVSGTVQTDVRNSVATVIIGGSVAVATGNSSVQVLNNVSVSGTVDVTFPTNQNVSGSVVAFQGGTRITSLVSTVPSSVIVGASIFGLPPVNVTNTNLNVGGSVVAYQGGAWTHSVVGTVATTQSGTWISSIVNTVPSSVIVGASIFGLPPVNVTNTNLNVGGSVVAFQGGTRITSISGIPQVSVHGTVQIFPSSMISGHGSVNGAASVQILAAPGTGLYNYVTDFLLSNTGSATTLVTFTDGDGSVIGKSIAPAGGGAVATAITSPMRTMQTNKVVNIAAATATSVLHAWVSGYKAP